MKRLIKPLLILVGVIVISALAYIVFVFYKLSTIERVYHFPEHSLINRIDIYKIKPDAPYDGLFEHYDSDSIRSIDDTQSAQAIYQYFVESFHCCAEWSAHEKKLAKYIVRFSEGGIQKQSVTLRIHVNGFDIGINASPKKPMSKFFRLPKNRKDKLLKMLGEFNFSDEPY